MHRRTNWRFLGLASSPTKRYMLDSSFGDKDYAGRINRQLTDSNSGQLQRNGVTKTGVTVAEVKWPLVQCPYSYRPEVSRVNNNHEKIKYCRWSKAVPLHATEALVRRKNIVLILDLGTRRGWVVSVTPRPRFSPGERTPGNRWTGGWVGSRAGLDTEATGKILCLCRGSNHDHAVVQSGVRNHTHWATPFSLNTAVNLNVLREKLCTIQSDTQPPVQWVPGILSRR
jgi:hypothetical protein